MNQFTRIVVQEDTATGRREVADVLSDEAARAVERLVGSKCTMVYHDKPMKLTGHESSVLAFLAQRPDAIDQFKSSLGQDALLVAQYLANIEQVVAPAVKETGDAIRAWAKEREDRERRAVVSVLSKIYVLNWNWGR